MICMLYIIWRRPNLNTDGSTEKPDPPIQVAGQDPTSKSITVTWKAPDYDGGCAIQGYILEKMLKDLQLEVPLSWLSQSLGTDMSQ